MAMTEKDRIRNATELAKAKSFELPGLARKMSFNMTPRRGQPEIRNRKKPTPTSAVRRTPYAYTGPDTYGGGAVRRNANQPNKYGGADRRTGFPAGATPDFFDSEKVAEMFDNVRGAFASSSVTPGVQPQKYGGADRRKDPATAAPSMGAVARGKTPGYSARQVTPGVTEVISPGQEDQSRFFTNLIESGANPTQLRGFMENQRAQGVSGAEASYEGPLSDRGGAVSRRPVGYNAVTRGERPGGVYSVGRSRRRRGLGGIAAAAAEGRANKTSAVMRQRDRELDIRDRRATIDEQTAAREVDYGSPQNQLRMAQAQYYTKQAESMLSKKEQMQYNQLIEKDKNVAKLYGMLEEPGLTDTDRERIYQDIEAYKQGLILTMVDPGKEAVDNWGPFNDPEVPPTFEYLPPEQSTKRRTPAALRRKTQQY